MDAAVSVIIPVYNMKEYLPECLDSVARQTLKEVEIICIDDGSVDGSSELLRTYAQKYKNMRLLEKEHQCSGAARNLGIRVATGEYIAFLDADDFYISDDALEYLYRQAKLHESKICGGEMLRFDMKGNRLEQLVVAPFGADEERDFLQAPLCYGFTRFIYQREMLLAHQVFFPEYKRGQDDVFELRAMIAAQKYYVSKKPIYYWRIIPKDYFFTDEEVAYGKFCAAVDLIELLSHCQQTEAIKEMALDFLRIRIAPYLPVIYANMISSKETKKCWENLNRLWCSLCDEEEFWILGWKPKDNLSMEWIRSKKEMICKYLIEEKKRRDKWISDASKIAIYGAGRFGMRVLQYLREKAGRNPTCFIVSKLDGNEETIDGIPLHSKYDFQSLQSYDVIIAMKEDWHSEIQSVLHNLHAHKVLLWGRQAMIDIYCEKWYEI